MTDPERDRSGTAAVPVCLDRVHRTPDHAQQTRSIPPMFD